METEILINTLKIAIEAETNIALKMLLTFAKEKIEEQHNLLVWNGVIE